MESITYHEPSLSNFDLYTFGEGKGPELVITAGIHGVEQTAIYTAYQFIDYFTQHPPKGTVRIIPIVNKPAYFNRDRVSPYDRIDLNRIFPGNPSGTQTEQLAHKIWEVTRNADYIIDLHCCGEHGSTYIMSLYSEYDHQYTLARKLGIENIVHTGGARGQLFLEACHEGQQAMLIEMKGGQPDGVVDVSTADSTFKKLKDLFRYTGNIPSENDVEDKYVQFHHKMTTMKSNRHAFFRPYMSAGTRCKKGDILGMLDNEKVQAPFDGYIAAINRPRYCFSGERMVRIAENNM
ncbi:succinylglutamate desuccinylase/aspartoacylase family protein [Staphylococcus argensis]|nr:succinylglutamate desuccinylase/aspartoacylase family protein [Staphylococcus argensis]